MFKFKYNILVFMQIMIQFLNSVFMIRIFGTSIAADSYFLSLSIITTIQLIPMLFIEQFMYFYNDLKVTNRENAYAFFNSAFFFALFIGVTFSIICLLSAPTIIRLFAYNLDSVRFSDTLKILSVLCIGLAALPANQVLNKLLNAESHFSVPYISATLPSLMSCISLIYLYARNMNNIYLVGIWYSLGGVGGIILSFLGAKYVGVPFKFQLMHPYMQKFIKNSFSMKFAYNIHNFFSIQIINNILSVFSPGYMAAYYYADKIIGIIFTMSLGPCRDVLYAKVSERWSSKDFREIKGIIITFLSVSVPLFLILSFAAFGLIPAVLKFISKGTMTDSVILIIQNIFVFLALWRLILVIEAAFVSVGISARNSKVFLATNTIFIGLFFLIATSLKNNIQVFAIPIAGAIAQLFNLAVFSAYALILLRVIDPKKYLIKKGVIKI